MHTIRSLLLATAVLPLATAQDLPAPFRTRAADLDSGYRDNATDHTVTVFRGAIRFDDALWLRLRFAPTNLPPGSSLRLVAAADRAEQRLDARSLADWQHGSAYFNGGEVEVELIAGPHTRANRVAVEAVEVGELQAMNWPETLCNADDRVLSSDPRAGRQFPGGCTVWLINEFTVLTAGHCAGPNNQAHFNVPLSTASGQVVVPPPQDQYPYDGPTLRSRNQGAGADWAVVATVRNSTTGLYAGQAQGAWFELSSPPASATGQKLRVTGYGSVSSPVSPTWNQVQKTDAGDMARLSTSIVGGYADVTGGNSGSPMIWEQTGKAIGITTHCPCPGIGTRVDLPDVQAAIQAVLASKVVGKFRPFGAGCPGTNGTPTLANQGYPTIGQRMSVDVANLAPAQAGALLFGLSSTTWSGGSLPRDLSAIGMTGCMQLHDWALASISTTTGTGTVSVPLSVPQDPALVGARAFVQFANVDAGANPFGAVTSNAAELVVGRD
jgi:V8-like Glu-specific endopeptidase